MKIFSRVVLCVATFPFAYYLIVLYSAVRFFGAKKREPNSGFTPPISNLKPIRGLDPDAYENFASLCRQNYPDYELLFCVGSPDDPAVPILERLKKDFPECAIRIIVSSNGTGVNDKCQKLARLVNEAKHEFLVINDSDVHVDPNYFRTVIAPLRNEETGAVTCFYLSSGEHTFADNLQTIGMASDFFAGLLVAQQLDGVKFALGKTIASRRANLIEFGGYEALVNLPADDLLVGRLIAERGHTVELLPYSVSTVANLGSMSQLLEKRMRWMVEMRHMRPFGHLGLVFTHGLPWSLAAIAVDPALAAAYIGTYLALRLAMTWVIGVRGLGKHGLWKQMPLIVAWDAVACGIWLASFTRNRFRWRDGEYYLLDGHLVRVGAPELLRDPRRLFGRPITYQIVYRTAGLESAEQLAKWIRSHRYGHRQQPLFSAPSFIKATTRWVTLPLAFLLIAFVLYVLPTLAELLFAVFRGRPWCCVVFGDFLGCAVLFALGLRKLAIAIYAAATVMESLFLFFEILSPKSVVLITNVAPTLAVFILVIYIVSVARLRVEE